MDDSRRKKTGRPDAGSAVDRLTQAIAFHRATLSTPIDDHFMTPEQLREMPLPPEPGPQWRQAGQFMITRAMCTLEVLAGERAPILAAVRWPLAGIITLRQGKRIRNVLAPGVYILSSPLTDSERTELHTRQATQLREFDDCTTQTRPTLLHLVEDGADPLVVLSVLIRYMPIRGTEAPRAQSVSLRSREFDCVPWPIDPQALWRRLRTGTRAGSTSCPSVWRVPSEYRRNPVHVGDPDRRKRRPVSAWRSSLTIQPAPPAKGTVMRRTLLSLSACGPLGFGAMPTSPANTSTTGFAASKHPKSFVSWREKKRSAIEPKRHSTPPTSRPRRTRIPPVCRH